MAFIPAENVAQVELRATYFDQQVENTLYYYYPDGLNTGVMATLANYIDTWWNAYLKPLQSASLVFREVYVTDLTSSSAPTVADTSSAGITGTGSATPGLPGNVSACVSFRTNGRGRSARGRNYFVGITEGSVSGNEMSPTFKAALLDAYEALILAPEPGFDWIVLSRYSGGAPRAEGLVQTVTSVVIVDDYVDSQRRRLTGRGN